MKKSLIAHLGAGTGAVVALLALPAAAQTQSPTTPDPAGASPSILLRARTLHQPPLLIGTGTDAQRNAQAFLDWASFSTEDERDDGRRALAAAQGNRDIAQAFCDEANRSQREDFSRAQVALALLGEMRSSVGESCLNAFLQQPLPTTGTVIEGEIVEQTQLAMLQAQAVEGLAWLRSSTGDTAVLRAAGGNPHVVVRAAAINAYLWNHGDTTEAKQTVLRYVRTDETIFADRVRREPGETAATFNAKLDTFRRAHPELEAPRPVRISGDPKTNPPAIRPVEPPAW
jgi:hypothetical protein